MLNRYLGKFFSLGILVFGVLFFPNITSAAPATIVGFEMAGLAGNEVSVDATTNDVNLQTATVYRGAGINPSVLANAFSATAFVAAGTKADAITQNEFFQVTIEPKNDHRLFLTELNYIIRRSGTGPDTMQWQYSLDNFATAGIDVGAEASYTGTAANGVAMPAIDLSVIPALQNLPSGTKVTFRLYAWGASAGTGTFAIGRLAGDDLVFVGEVLPNKIATFELLGQNGDEVTVDASYEDTNIKTVTLSRGSGIIPSVLFNAYSARNFTFDGTKTDAIADNEYFELTIEAEDFYRLNFNDLHFHARRSTLGPISYQWQYSFDEFLTPGVDLGAEGLYTGDADTGAVMPSINLSSIPALQKVKKVTFRLYAWGGTNVNGTFAFGRLAGDDLVFTGTVTPNIIVAFDPVGTNGDQATFDATTLDANLQNSILTRGSGINPSFLLNAFSANDFVVGGGKADAVSNNEYFQFNLESLTGYDLYLGFLDSNLRRSGTGPNAYQWQYSLDDFATAGVDLGIQYAYLTSEDTGTARPRVDMSLIPALQNIQPGNPITLRLYAWGATGAPGSFAIGRLTSDDLAIAGEVKIKTYNVNYLAGANGSITGNISQVVNFGASSTAVTAVPDVGYHFVKWSDNSTDNPRIDGNVTSNITVTAEFAINTYTLNYTAGVNGSLIGSLNQVVNHGTNGTAITAIPAAGYVFTDWSDSSTDNPRTDLNVTGNIAVTANFTFSVALASGGGAYYPPNGIGDGRVDKTIAMDAVKEVGVIDRGGINLLTFVRSQAVFDTMESDSSRTNRHSIKIVEVDLYRNIVAFEVASNPQIFRLNENEKVEVDLDGDNIQDISIQFMGVYINRVELTVKSLLDNEGVFATDSSKAVENGEQKILSQSSFVFGKNLETGMIDSDVKELQKFLNNNGYVITDAGPGSPGQETDKFGAFTRNALIKYQITNDISPALGYFGADTRAFVNRQLKGDTAGNAPDRLLGRILLQVQNHGEAWYVRKSDAKRYYMLDGKAAYEMMRSFSVGISDTDLAKIPKVQTTGEMNQVTSVCSSNALANRLKGDILLQVQQHGEAWYVDPVKCRAIYLKDGDAAYEIMRFLGLGITNADLEKITATQ